MIKSALILTGGDYFPDEIEQDELTSDVVIAADCGRKKAEALGVKPTLYIGDFDSSPIPPSDENIEIAPRMKDETDTMLAVDRAVEMGAKSLTIIGGTGGRIDHTLSNVLMLEGLKDNGVSAVLTDGRNRVRIAKDETVTLTKTKYKYFGVIALTDCTVTIDGAVYPLTEAKLERSHPYAVSNEIAGKTATVTVKGTAIITES